MIEIKNLHAEIDGKEILKGIDLNLEKGKVHAIMKEIDQGATDVVDAVSRLS